MDDEFLDKRNSKKCSNFQNEHSSDRSSEEEDCRGQGTRAKNECGGHTSPEFAGCSHSRVRFEDDNLRESSMRVVYEIKGNLFLSMLWHPTLPIQWTLTHIGYICINLTTNVFPLGGLSTRLQLYRYSSVELSMILSPSLTEI